MTRRGAMACLLVLGVASCSDSASPDNAGAHLVQISNVEVASKTMECRARPNDWQIYVAITLVNTTSDTVRVNSISSSGQIIRSSRAELVGTTAYGSPSLAFTPTDAALRSHDGQVTYTAVLNGCVPGGTSGSDFIDVQVTLFVQTTAGEFATQPLVFNQLYH